jgi:hypothetical protein
MPTESTMRCERSKPLKVNREDIGLPVRKAHRPISVSIDPIDLWPKVAERMTGRSNPSLSCSRGPD